MYFHRAFIHVIGGVVLTLGIAACGGGGSSGSSLTGMAGAPPVPVLTVANLVSDGAIAAAHTDINLKNAWGISFAPGAPVWIANNGSNTSTLYDGTGVQQPPTVVIPSGTNGNANPTGIVANTTTDFVINPTEGPALFIFASEGGTISAWATVNATLAVTKYDDGVANGANAAVYKGLAIANNGAVNRLYATDFHNNKIDVFDATFNKVTVTGGFADATLPTGFAPFGIQAIGNQLYVTYAKQLSPGNRVGVSGAGLGYVNLFDANGTFIKRIVSAGVLNEPWGVAMAPAGFGVFGNTLLIANFGDGTINAFDASSGASMGALKDASDQTIAIPGLWGIAFGNGAFSQSTATLYFTAGPNGEVNGLYGSITSSTGMSSTPVGPGY